MLITIILIAAVALGWPLVLRGNASGRPSPPAGLDRRMKWVERHPGEANTGDIERMLTAGGLCLEDVRKVSDKAFRLGIKPFTMWMFIQTYGARELAVAVAAEVSHDELLEHLAEGSLPNFAELEVFAALNGLRAASHDPADESRSRRDRLPEMEKPASGPSRTLDDLDIHEPGDWDGVPDNLTSFEVPSDEPVADWDFGEEFGESGKKGFGDGRVA